MDESFNHFSSSLLTRRLSDNDMEMCFNCKAACLPPLVTPGLIMTGGAIDPYNETKTAIIMTRHDQCKKWKQAFPTKLLLELGAAYFIHTSLTIVSLSLTSIRICGAGSLHSLAGLVNKKTSLHCFKQFMVF